MIYALLFVALCLIVFLSIARNEAQAEAKHWNYVASRLRMELNDAADELDKHAPTDALTPTATRIARLAARSKCAPTCGLSKIQQRIAELRAKETGDDYNSSGQL